MKSLSMNKKVFLEAVATLFSIIHVFALIIIFFGFLFHGIMSYVYIGTLCITLLSWLLLGYCPLTKWEFDIRKKYSEPPSYHYEYLHYWGYKLFKININPKIITVVGTIFLIFSIAAWIFVHFN